MKKLTRSFFNRNTVKVAKDLIGKVLVYKEKKGVTKEGVIIETEAYRENDEACHAFGGETPRTRVMFGEPGRSYVYFIYGMYYCLNIITESKGKGCAVLIRKVLPLKGVKGKCDGPGKLCKSFRITRKDNDVDLCGDSFAGGEKFYILDRGIRFGKINSAIRIGISKSKEKKWRFFIDEKELAL